MKYSITGPLAITALAYSATAFVLPPPDLTQATVHADRPNHQTSSSSWWESLHDLASESSINSFIEDSVDQASATIDEVTKSWTQASNKVFSFVHDTSDKIQHSTNGGGRHDHEFPDYTIYQLVKASNYTKKFAKIIDDYPKVVKILNGTKAEHNHTLFVPIDEAFEHIPDDDKHKPSKEVIDAALLYHIGIGNLDARTLLKSNTVPTALKEKYLGDEQQRIRTSVGLGGLKLNFYDRIVAGNIKAKNGIIHGVRELLIPPPLVGRAISLFPGEFSTLLLAYEKTDFVKFVHGIKLTGSTVFAPSNGAFKKLGPRANAFLFNSKTGLKYLKAILKYHIVGNATLYTDAFYDETGKKDGEEVDAATGTEHFDLVTLLDGAHLGVDIAEWASLKFVKVNGFINVAVRDAIAKNGVIHVVDQVLIPPRKHKGDHNGEESWSGEVEVEELIERLADYVEDETDESLEL